MKTRCERTERLIALMAEHDLSALDVGTLLGRKRITVAIWRCASDGRVIPSDALQLLEIKLSAKAV